MERVLSCWICKENKSENEFYVNSKRSTGRSSGCKECERKRAQAIRDERASGYIRPIEGLKKCNGCGYTKGYLEFSICKGSVDGLYHRCRDCVKKKHKERRLEALRVCSNCEIPYCFCCGETTFEFLSVDHIYGGGNKKRKEKGCSLGSLEQELKFNKDKLRVLCHNCNLSLGFYGYCPHRNEQP